MKIVIGSTSERKIKTAERIIREIFKSQKQIDVLGSSAPSGVPDTPFDKQTFDGARNRAANARLNIPGADYYIGIESGLAERYGHIYEEAWCAVISGEDEVYGYSSGLKVPDYILQKMDALKMKHSDVMAVLEKKHGKLPNDTWGSYSGGVLPRTVSLDEAVRNALIQVIAPPESFYRIKDVASSH